MFHYEWRLEKAQRNNSFLAAMDPVKRVWLLQKKNALVCKKPGRN
jgi:hypothetical protein